VGLAFLFSPRLWNAILDALSAREEARAQTLEDSKTDIANALRKLEGALLVVIDDVDRLPSDEIRAVFQLVKVNADFPRLIYLLLFDRGAVELALGEPSQSAGRDFVEKIIQVAFTVPTIDSAQLETALLTGLDQIIPHAQHPSIADDSRFSILFLFFRPYLHSLRRVYRLLSSLSLHMALFTQRSAVSINIPDFIALEVFRLYEPDLYDAIARSKDRLFGTDFDVAETDKSDRLASLLTSVPEARRSRAQSILEELFPMATTGATYSERHAGEWRRASRICADDVFDRYFQLRLGQEDLSASAIQQLLEASQASEPFERRLREFAGRGQLSAAVRALEAHKDELPIARTAGIVAALFTVSDAFPRVSVLSLRVGPDQFAAEIIRTLLRRIQSGYRDEVLLEASSRTSGIYLPLSLADEALGHDGDEPSIFSQEAASRLLADSLSRLVLMPPTDLARHPHLGVLLGIWRRRGSIDALRHAARELATTVEGALSLLRALSSRVQGTTGRGRGIRSEYRIRFKDLNDLVASSSIANILEGVDPLSLNFEDRLLLQAFQKGLTEDPTSTSS
jgi:hypothetical protein